MPKKRERKSHIWKKHPDNWYVESPWCADALFREHSFSGRIHDPCCGLGTIPDAAVNAGYTVTMADIADRGNMHATWGRDFKVGRYQDEKRKFDNIVTNPPFDDINKPPLPFVQWALSHVKEFGASGQVALLVPFKWFGGDRRSRILEGLPVSHVYVLTPRPSMPPGDALMKMWDRGEKPGGGKEDFAWVIFGATEERPPTLGWLHRDENT